MNFSGMFDRLILQSENAIAKNARDYYQDGLLYCGKCRTPKQCRIEVCDEIKTPMCLCECEKNRIEQEEAEFKQRERQQRIEQMRSEGFYDREILSCTFDKDDGANARITEICKRYVANFDEMKRKGKGLLFFGTVGTGKTFFAACIANALINNGYPCLVTNFARLTNKLFSMTDKQEYLDSFNRFNLLVIDDLATERNTEYMNEVVFNLIDSRYRSGLPLIVTTNLTAEELKHPADITKARVYSRLFEMCLAVEVKGSDRRRKKMIADHNELEALLGL